MLADRTRALPVVDPYDRELTISCGAAIGCFEIAARCFGWQVTVDHIADRWKRDCLAHLSLQPGTEPSHQDRALFDAIAQRRTDRTMFSPDPVPDDLVHACQKAASDLGVEFAPVHDKADRQAIAALVAEGDYIQFDDPRFRRELAAWVHSWRSGSRDGMSGASFGMSDALAPVARYVIRTFDIGENIAAADEHKIVDGSPMLGVFASPNDDREDWTNTGRALAHILLLLTSRGGASSYLNQPVEVEALRPKLRDAVGLLGHPQILIRAGKSAANLPPTARRDLDEMILR